MKYLQKDFYTKNKLTNNNIHVRVLYTVLYSGRPHEYNVITN